MTGWVLSAEQAHALVERPEACCQKLFGFDPSPPQVRLLRAIGQAFDGAEPGSRVALVLNRSGLLQVVAVPDDVEDPVLHQLYDPELQGFAVSKDPFVRGAVSLAPKRKRDVVQPVRSPAEPQRRGRRARQGDRRATAGS